jgi:hypothetical protein
MTRSRWELAFALLAGLVVGLLYSWLISPLQYVDTTPDTLRADFKERYRIAIAAAYASTGNLQRAQARLNLLGDGNSVDALSSQAQRMLASGEDFETVRQVAQLASDLQNPGALAFAFTPTAIDAQAANTPDAEHSGATAPAAGTAETVASNEVATPPQDLSTATPRPTRTATPAQGAPFELSAQETLCGPGLSEGLLQIMLLDTRRRQLPGQEIIVTWDGGEDHFFTGLKPELGDGYADYVMEPDLIYSVRVAQGGAPISNVSAPSCAADGGSITGAIRLTFQQQ